MICSAMVELMVASFESVFVENLGKKLMHSNIYNLRLTQAQ